MTDQSTTLDLEKFSQPLQHRSQALTTILPDIPLLSSVNAGWKGILVESYRYPAYEIPEYCFAEHKIVLHTRLTDAIQSERVLDGKFQSESLSNGAVVAVPANTPHQVLWDQPAEFTVLTLDPMLLAQSAYESIHPDRVELIPQFPNSDPLIYSIGMALQSELMTEQSARQAEDSKRDHFYVESLTTALCAHLLKRYANHSPKPIDATDCLPKLTLAQAIEYIHDHLDQEIRLVDLAEQLGFSPCYFSSLFKRSTGLSPHQYVIQRRLWRAKELLKTTNHPISEIALQSGFANQSHLTRLFRQHFAITPKVYRHTL